MLQKLQKVEHGFKLNEEVFAIFFKKSPECFDQVKNFSKNFQTMDVFLELINHNFKQVLVMVMAVQQVLKQIVIQHPESFDSFFRENEKRIYCVKI